MWEELKKIESQAEQIRTEAQSRAKDIVNLANEDAEKLVVNSKTYAEEEAQRLHQLALKEANENREKQLTTIQKTTDEMKQAAGKRMDQAVDSIVKAVVETADT